MVSYTSKFNQLHESAYSRYTQGAGFLAGDVVKFKSNVARSDWFKNKPESMQKLVLSMADAPGNLRIGVLKNEFPYTIGAHGASDNPAIMADIYVELSPANWAYPMTVPLNVLERIETGINLAPVPDAVRDNKDRVDIKGSKKKKDKDNGKRTLVDDIQRQNPTSNTVLPNGKKWDDSKVGGGNMPKTKLKESVSLEDAYQCIMEGTEMPMTGPNTSTEETQHVIEGGEFNACDYESLEDGKVSVRFEDTVYSSIADDEVAVTVIAVCSPAGGSGTSGWVLDDVSVTDQTGKPITIDAKDTDYLSSRAADFAHKYNGTPELVTSEDDSAMSGPNDVSLYDESPGDTVTIGRHTISREDKTVGREDPTQRLTYSFDNGYTLINFWGWELLDPSGHRLVHADKSSEINLTLKRMNLPTIDEIDDAFDAIDGSLEAGDSAYYDRQIGDMSP